MKVRPVVRCKLIKLIEHPDNRYTALIRRMSAHPFLGPPKDVETITSEINTILFDVKILVTRNTIYDFRSK